MVLARQAAVLVGFALLSSFITVMVVYYMVPVDPLDPEPILSYRILFSVVFVVSLATLTIVHAVGRRVS